MRTDYVRCVGSHQCRITLKKGYRKMILNGEEVYSEDQYVVEYNLYGCNGTTVSPRPSEPNAHGWKTSSETFPATLAGLRGAASWADHLLRPQDGRND